MRKIILLVFGLILFIHSSAQALPAIQHVLQYSETANLSAHTTTAFTPLGQNRMLVLCVTAEQSTGPPDKRLLSATFNAPGSPQSFVFLADVRDGFNTDYAAVWVLVNPSSVSASITYVHTDPVASVGTVVALSGMAQSTPTLTSNDFCNNCGANGVTADLTTTEANSLLMTCAGSSSSGHSHTQGPGQTELREISINSLTHSVSSELKVTPGLETLTTTAVGVAPSRSYYVVFAAEPAAEVATSRRRVSPRRID